MPLLLLVVLMLSGCHNNVTPPENTDPEPGIPLTLATQRAQTIESLSYDLSFTIPADQAEPISGRAIIRFAAKDVSRPLVLDFSPGADYVKSVSAGGRPSHYRLIKDHIIIPREEIASEDNRIEIAFRAGEAPLNRNPDFLLRLFLPF